MLTCVCCSGPVARVLLFNATGERDSAAMLKLLVVSTTASHNTEKTSVFTGNVVVGITVCIFF